jgi:hypothetical protein
LADGLQQDLKYLPNVESCDEEGLYDCLIETGYNVHGRYAPWEDKACAGKFGCDVKPSMLAMNKFLANT